MQNISGMGAKKRFSKRRLNMIDSTISIHCGILNTDERMDLVREYNEVAKILAEIKNEKQEAREQKI